MLQAKSTSVDVSAIKTTLLLFQTPEKNFPIRILVLLFCHTYCYWIIGIHPCNMDFRDLSSAPLCVDLEKLYMCIYFSVASDFRSFPFVFINSRNKSSYHREFFCLSAFYLRYIIGLKLYIYYSLFEKGHIEAIRKLSLRFELAEM